MTDQCQITPALNSAIKAHPPATAAAVRALCSQLGKPLSTGVRASLRNRHYHGARLPAIFHTDTPSLCGNAGCAYIWLFNDANGYGEAEYQADPSIGVMTGGIANFTRYTESNNSSSGWNDSMEHNCGPVSWCGYRYIYPIAGLNGSWVHVMGVGTAIINDSIVASWGPVDTWNYITR